MAEGKGVHCEVKSEESQVWGYINPRANLWSDEKKSHMRSCTRERLQHKLKPNSYAESKRKYLKIAFTEKGHKKM